MLVENILNYGRVKSSLNSCLDKKKIYFCFCAFISIKR